MHLTFSRPLCIDVDPSASNTSNPYAGLSTMNVDVIYTSRQPRLRGGFGSEEGPSRFYIGPSSPKSASLRSLLSHSHSSLSSFGDMGLPMVHILHAHMPKL